MRNLDYFVSLEKFILVHAGFNCKIDNPFTDIQSMLWLRDYEILPEKIWPQPTMVLVDLQKVSSTAFKQRQRSLDSPAVKGYRVLEYKSIGGVDVTRVELTVTDAAKLQVKETRNGLQLTLRTVPPRSHTGSPCQTRGRAGSFG